MKLIPCKTCGNFPELHTFEHTFNAKRNVYWYSCCGIKTFLMQHKINAMRQWNTLMKGQHDKI